MFISVSLIAIWVQSYEKSREGQNKFICFFFRDGTTSPIYRQSYGKSGEMQKKIVFFFCISETKEYP